METFWGFTTWEEGIFTGFWIEARDTDKHPSVLRTAPTTKNYAAQMSIVPKLRKPGLTYSLPCYRGS
jgi:hypothetical protein